MSDIFEPRFRWLHLSDLHFGHGQAGHAWDQQLVLGQLLRDIQDVVARGDVDMIDAVFITGDVAYSGGARSSVPTYDEYKAAGEWLAELIGVLRISERHVFIVPGNHDVDHRVVDGSRSARRLLESLRAGGSQDTVDAALADDVDSDLLTQRFRGFLDFARPYGPFASLSTSSISADGLFWRDRLSVSELEMELAGLNTALLSQRDDHGVLAVGTRQLAETLPSHAQAQAPALTIALSHHPVSGGWLRDEINARNHIRARATIHLCGHIHEMDAEAQFLSAGGQHVVCVAGAAHAAQGEPAWHGYTIGAVGQKGSRYALRLRPRQWSPRAMGFRQNSALLPEGQPYVELAIDVRAPTGGTPVRAGAEPSAPEIAADIEDNEPDEGGFLDFLASADELTNQVLSTVELFSQRMETYGVRISKVADQINAVAGQPHAHRTAHSAAKNIGIELLRMRRDVEEVDASVTHFLNEFEAGRKGLIQFAVGNPSLFNVSTSQVPNSAGWSLAGARASEVETAISSFEDQISRLRGVSRDLNAALRRLLQATSGLKATMKRMHSLTT